MAFWYHRNNIYSNGPWWRPWSARNESIVLGQRGMNPILSNSTKRWNVRSQVMSTAAVLNIAKVASPLKDSSHLWNLVEQISDSVRIVMIGEASHGTADFYRIRAEISKMLIENKGFHCIAVESDWPDALEVNKFFKGKKKDVNDALSSYGRFPRWMWRNDVVADFVTWMKQFNESMEENKQIGFYGLDMYSLERSRDEVVNYLESVDKKLAQIAKDHYSCFDKFGIGEHAYSFKMSLGAKDSCENDVVAVLNEMVKSHTELVRGSQKGEDEYFYALQNAKVIQNAENYYRNMFQEGETTWNIRDGHMFQCLVDLMKFKEEQQQRTTKVIVWAHNSHIGDARETEMVSQREINLGQLVRTHFPRDQHYNIGFTTFNGTVTAADSWNHPPQFMTINDGLKGSYESLFHHVVTNENAKFPHGRMILNMLDLEKDIYDFLCIPRLSRAIGVIYRPQTERWSHYLSCCLPKQFDSVIHVDKTQAVIPLEIVPQWIDQRDKYHQHADDVPELFPFGL